MAKPKRKKAKKAPEKRKPLRVPLLSDDELRKFVDDYVSGRILTSAQVPEHLWQHVFMVIPLGAFAGVTKSELAQIGCMYEELSKCGRMGVNGYPTFFSMRLLHIDDWKRARFAITRELERRKTIEV